MFLSQTHAMGSLRHFKRARMVPLPTGNPALIYKPYSFGQMKPIPLQNYSINITNAYATYASIFIPKNSLGNNKLITCSMLISIDAVLPNQIGGPTYTEQYAVSGVGNTQRMPPFVIAPVPTNFTGWIKRTLLFTGTEMIEIDFPGQSLLNSASNIQNVNLTLQFSHAIAPWNRSIDNLIEFQLKTSFATSADSIACISGQAFIQSPLDLRRLTP